MIQCPLLKRHPYSLHVKIHDLEFQVRYVQHHVFSWYATAQIF